MLVSGPSLYIPGSAALYSQNNYIEIIVVRGKHRHHNQLVASFIETIT